MRPEGSPRQDHRKHSQEKPDVSEADVNLFVGGYVRLPRISPLNVFFRGKHWLKM
jgi:hypothetical protein